MSFLELKDKTFLVVGVANRKGVAWSVAKLLQEEGAKILYCVKVKNERRITIVVACNETIFTCDFENESEIEGLQKELSEQQTSSLTEYYIRSPLPIIQRD